MDFEEYEGLLRQRYQTLAEFSPVGIFHTDVKGHCVYINDRWSEITGLNLVACWEKGHLVAAQPDTVLTEHTVAVVVGRPDQIAELDALFVIYNPNDNPVLVIGGGKVGVVASALDNPSPAEPINRVTWSPTSVTAAMPITEISPTTRP